MSGDSCITIALKASHTHYVLIFYQIYLNLWLTKKTIIEFNHTTIDTDEEKENSSAKPFIYYTVASHFVYIPRIKSNRTNQTYLRRSHIQYNQITTRDSLNLCSLYFFVFLFFCFITQAPLRQILTIFSFGITIQHLQLRGIFGSNILDKVGVKKTCLASTVTN